MGQNELKIGRGFVGASGIELLRMLNDAGIIAFTAEDKSYISRYYNESKPEYIDMIWNLHPEVRRTNVFQQHPPSNKIEAFCGGKADRLQGFPALIKGKFVRAEFAHELERLGDDIFACDPNLIICLGNSALWALAGQTGISKLRGTTSISSHTVSGYKLLATYHPAAVLRQWELRPTTVADLIKASSEAAYPEIRRPKREIWIEPSIEDIERFINDYIIKCEKLSVDIETSGTRITCIGFSPRADLAIVIPFDGPGRKNRNYWPTKEAERRVWDIVKGVLSLPRPTKTFQNGLYDLAFLWRAYGIKVYGAEHDTMLLHHALQPEALKSLGYLGSVYTDEGAWKNERKGTATIKRDE